MLNFLLSIIYKWTKFKRGEYPLSILYYHHVFADNEPYHPDDINAQDFERQIDYLQKHFNIFPLKIAIDLLRQKQLPPKALVISFDDGYQDNYTIAAPILEKLNCPAIFFIATEGVEKGYLWNDEIEQAIKNTTKETVSNKINGYSLSLKTQSEKTIAFHSLVNSLKFQSNKQRSIKITCLLEELNVSTFTKTMMTTKQLSDLYSRGFDLGAHTHSHTILATETNENVQQELLKNKNILENITNQSVDFLAYPNGLEGRDFSGTHCNIAQNIGFKAAFSTNDGSSINSTNMYKIPRFMPYRKQLPLFTLSIAKIAGEHV